MITMNNFIHNNHSLKMFIFKFISVETIYLTIVLTSTFIDLNLIVKNSNSEKPSTPKGLSYENCVLHNLFMQMSVCMNEQFVSTSNNLSNYASYIRFMLMTPMSHELLKGLVIGYEYKTDTDTTNIHRDTTTKGLHLVGKINHEIFNIPPWFPPNIKVDIKLQLALSNFILQ